MSIGRAVFLRPVEITSSNDSWSISGTAKTVTNGTYASMLTLLGKMKDQFNDVVASGNITVGYTGTGVGKVTLSASVTFSITWTDTNLRDMLGFTGNLSSASSYTATYPMRYTWISDYTPSDREWWALKHDKTYSGAIARSGELVGLANGNSIYHRTLKFDAETQDNLFTSASSNSYKQALCLETFIEGARASVPSVSSNAPTHGFWYCYDHANLFEIMYLDQMANYAGLDHADYRWAWCHLDPDGLRRPTPSLGVTRDWYSLELDIHTADEPTWDAP